MINDKGFALITIMFMLVTLISAVFLAAYPLVSEPRDTTCDYITNMKFHRYKRALFGRMADQCAGKFMSCGGQVSDYPSGGGASNAGDEAVDVYGRRHYIQRSGLGFSVRYPTPFVYDSNRGFWGGYWGKRYVYPLPSDDWYDDYGPVAFMRHAFLDGRGTQFFLHHGCNQDWKLKNNETPRHLPIKPSRTVGMKFNCMRSVNIKVRDHSEDRDINRDLTAILIRANDFRDDTEICSDPVEETGYLLYEFSFKTSISGNRKSSAAHAYSGLNKLLIQIGEVTKFTTGIVVPHWSSLLNQEPESGPEAPEITYKKEPFCITVDYYG